MTEVVRADAVRSTDGPAAELIAWARAAKAANDLAVPLCRTEFVPKDFRGDADAATAAILYGAEAGLSPLQALQGVYVISGKPAMYARTLMAVVLAAGHEVWTEEATDKRVVLCGRRRGSEHVERVEWTIERAKTAGYTKNPKYASDPQSMLMARAQSDVCRRVAPDAILGMSYSVEELEMSDEPPANGKRTVARKRPEPEIPWAAPAQLEPDRSNVLRAVADVDLPPLPGEAVAPPVEAAQAAPAAPTPAPAPEPEDRPGFITRAQLRMLHAVLNKAGLGNDRDAALAFYAEHGGGRIVESSKDLTRIEATRIIDALIEAADNPQDDDPEPGFDDDA